DVKGGEEKVAFEKKSYPYEGEVTVERLNVRMFPKNDQTSIITSVLGLGEKVTVLAEKDEYYQILPPKNSTVWVTAKNIKRDGDKGVATANEIPVRLDSRVNADVLCTLKEGESVKVTGEHMVWLKIEAPAAVKYYVGKKYVHLGAEVLPVAGPGPKAAKDETARKGVAPAAGSDAEAVALIEKAKRDAARQDQLISDKKMDEVDFTSIVEDYQAAAGKARTDAVRVEAERGLDRYREVNRMWAVTKAQMDEHRKLKAEQLKAAANVPAPEKAV